MGVLSTRGNFGVQEAWEMGHGGAQQAGGRGDMRTQWDAAVGQMFGMHGDRGVLVPSWGSNMRLAALWGGCRMMKGTCRERGQDGKGHSKTSEVCRYVYILHGSAGWVLGMQGCKWVQEGW